MQSLVAQKRDHREAQIQQAIDILRQRLEALGLSHLEITGRPKHLYSIYQKMARQQKEFHEIFDVAAVRLMVRTHDECYRALAVVHDCFRPFRVGLKTILACRSPIAINPCIRW